MAFGGDERVTRRLQLKRLAVDFAIAVEGQGLGAAVGGLVGCDGANEMQLTDLVRHQEVPVAEV